MSMRSRVSPGVLLLLSLTALAADPIEPLDGDFLDYLANMEGDDDDWTLLADVEEAPTAPREAGDDPGKTSKEAAQPAVEKR
jgi:hypothetical protein